MIAGSTEGRVNENRDLPLSPRLELDMAQRVRLAAAQRLFAEATLHDTQPTDLDILANRVLALPPDTAGDDYVHVPVDYAEGIHLTGPAATPRLEALWNSFLGLICTITQQYEGRAIGRESCNGVLDLFTDRAESLADQFLVLMQTASELTVQEVQTVLNNLPAALEQVADRLPSIAAIEDALTDVQRKLPAPAQQTLNIFVQAAPVILAVTGTASTPASILSLVVNEVTKKSPSTPVDIDEIDEADAPPPVPPRPTLLNRISNILCTDNAVFTYIMAAFSLCIFAMIKIKIDESLQLSEYCLTASEDTRSAFDFFSDPPQTYDECIANGWPRV